ncbi:MAG: glycosyl transferase family 2 [Verrucomicrobia bacterium]|nr:glycosyl transferase family 2 [Verrucomicrobiota bacterium]
MNPRSALPISVVIPTYNRATHVSISIESVLAQTSPPFEIIVVDDGSTDDTPAALAKYGDRIRVIRQINAGPSAARNTGIEAAKAEWISFLDDDDVYTPDRLRIAAESMRLHPDAAVHLSNIAIVTDGVLETDLFTLRGLKATEHMRLERPLSWCLRGCVFVQTLVIRKSTAMTRGLFKKMFYEDLDFIIRLCAQTPWTVDSRPAVHLNRRTGEKHSVSAFWKTKPIENYETLVRIYGDLCKTPELDSLERSLAENSYAANLYDLGCVYLTNDRPVRAKACFIECSQCAPRRSTRIKSWLPRLLGPTGAQLVEYLSRRKKLRST